MVGVTDSILCKRLRRLLSGFVEDLVPYDLSLYQPHESLYTAFLRPLYQDGLSRTLFTTISEGFTY